MRVSNIKPNKPVLFSNKVDLPSNRKINPNFPNFPDNVNFTDEIGNSKNEPLRVSILWTPFINEEKPKLKKKNVLSKEELRKNSFMIKKLQKENNLNEENNENDENIMSNEYRYSKEFIEENNRIIMKRINCFQKRQQKFFSIFFEKMNQKVQNFENKLSFIQNSFQTKMNNQINTQIDYTMKMKSQIQQYNEKIESQENENQKLKIDLKNQNLDLENIKNQLNNTLIELTKSKQENIEIQAKINLLESLEKLENNPNIEDSQKLQQNYRQKLEESQEKLNVLVLDSQNLTNKFSTLFYEKLDQFMNEVEEKFNKIQINELSQKINELDDWIEDLYDVLYDKNDEIGLLKRRLKELSCFDGSRKAANIATSSEPTLIDRLNEKIYFLSEIKDQIKQLEQQQ
ncbi:hypothetical protein TRFO_26043 [Tritrichomonas foetus]|uniref:Uncharacterized protein n=1 Tax=Tritrichomonas foetus TaxID=1144522 RepID=A0A1J4K8I8_9EUKA|nr:hypothetical protein TRFO_26043 [Tritrichomonas foetus]|eukprot:OHT05982.1 hypothetical protein TRFO_26043 [Tritrichomonas foetus]